MGNTLKKTISCLVLSSLVLSVYLSYEPKPVEVQEATSEIVIIQTESPTVVSNVCESSFELEQEEIRDEIYYGEIELLALVIQAEAGNQDELGKRYVADVVMNRVNSKDFPDTISEVLYQKNPIQFACTVDGALDKAGYTITEDCFRIAEEEYWEQQNTEIVYFRTGQYHSSGHPAFKHQDHYFSTK